MTRLQRLLLSAASGILLSLPWLGFPGWTLFIALIPLLYLDNYFVDFKEGFPVVSFWGHSFLAFFIWNGLTTWWVVHATVIGVVMAVSINSFLMSLVWWLAHAARRKFKSNLGYITLVVLWLSFEYIHYNWDIQWPALNLGNGFANNVKIVQWFEFTGVLGGSLWIFILNILFFKLFKLSAEKDKSGKLRVLLLVEIVFFIAAPVFYSLAIYSGYTETGNSRQIVLVQPNVDPYSESFSIVAEGKKCANFIRLAESEMNGDVDFIIGPETVFERYMDWNVEALSSNQHFITIARWLKNYPNAELLFGVSTSKVYPNEKQATPTARNKKGIVYDVFNSAVFTNYSGDYQIYHKSILVSGVEKVPYMRYLGFLRTLFFNLGGASGTLGSQEEASVFASKDSTRVAPVICYESVFGEYNTNFVKKGAELIFVITNDGWWKNSPGYKQHMSFARLRAIETRRSIARAANTGISCFINQRGDVLKRTNWWEEDAIRGKLNTNNKLTFYVKYGDYIGRISLFISVLFVLLLITKRFR